MNKYMSNYMSNMDNTEAFTELFLDKAEKTIVVNDLIEYGAAIGQPKMFNAMLWQRLGRVYSEDGNKGYSGNAIWDCDLKKFIYWIESWEWKDGRTHRTLYFFESSEVVEEALSAI